MPELNALETVARFSERPEQSLFGDADRCERSARASARARAASRRGMTRPRPRPPPLSLRYEIREATARQEALVESLNATIAAGETLQKELDAHASSQQSVYSFQLTVLGCVLSVLGFCSISIDALSLLHEMDALSLLKMLR